MILKRIAPRQIKILPKYLPIVSKENLLPVETQNEENTNPTGMFISVKNPDSSEQPTVSFQLKN